MAKRISSNKETFPYEFHENGRFGRIFKWADKFAISFKFRGKTYRNSFKSFDAAFSYLKREFSKLDSSSEDSTSVYPLRYSPRTYHELEKKIEAKFPESTVVDAVDFYLSHHERLNIKERSVDECSEQFIRLKEKANVTTLHLKTIKKHLRRFSGTFGTRLISGITAQEINTYLFEAGDPRNGQIWSAKTRNNNRATIITLATYSRDVLNALPEHQLRTAFQKSPPTKYDNLEAVDIYSPQEIAKILEAAIRYDLEIIPIIVLGAFQGLRPFEAHGEQLKRERLGWSAFNWDRRVLSIEGQKVRSKRTRQLEINDATYAWLHPFSKLKGLLWKKSQSHSRRLQRIREISGVRSVINGFRHSYASYRLAITDCNTVLVSREMGNSPNELVASYRKELLAEEGLEWFLVRPPEGYAKTISSLLKIK